MSPIHKEGNKLCFIYLLIYDALLLPHIETFLTKILSEPKVFIKTWFACSGTDVLFLKQNDILKYNVQLFLIVTLFVNNTYVDVDLIVL